MKTVLAATVCGVLLVSGCSSDEESATTEGPAVVSMPVSDNMLLVAGPASAGEERVTGQPTFVNGCLGATSGDKTYLVVWPSGTTVAGPDSDAIRFGDEVLEPGQSFVGTGTMVAGKPFPPQFPELPLSCIGPNEEKIMWVREIVEISE